MMVAQGEECRVAFQGDPRVSKSDKHALQQLA